MQSYRSVIKTFSAYEPRALSARCARRARLRARTEVEYWMIEPDEQALRLRRQGRSRERARRDKLPE